MTPERKTLFGLLALLGVVAGVGVAVWQGVYVKDTQATRQKDHDTRLFAPQKVDEKLTDGGSPPAEFTRVTITAKGETTVLERTPPAPWRLTRPVAAKADQLVVDGIVSQLQQAKFKDTIDEAPDEQALAKYGLTTPTFTVEATAQVGGEARTVKLVGGGENTFDGSIFMRRNDDPTVYAAMGGARFAFERSSFELREKRVLAVETAKVTSVAVTSAANRWKLEKGADTLWKLTEPEATAADSTAVRSLLDGLSTERAEAFPPDTQQNRVAFGLEPAAVDATLTRAGGAPVRIRLGKQEADGGSPTWYALREDEDGALLAQMAATAPAQLDRYAGDLRDKSVVPFNKELITRMVFHNADGSEVVVARPAADAGVEHWAVTAPTPGPAKVFKVTSALWVLGALKGSQQVEPDAKNAKKYGLGPGARFIALYGPDAAVEVGRLVIGDPVPDVQGSFYALGKRPEIVMVDGSRFGELPVTVAEVLDVPADAGAPSAP